MKIGNSAVPFAAMGLIALLQAGCGGGDSDTVIVTETEYQSNSVPVIAIDGLSSAVMASEFSLDGSGSYDIDGTIESWSWTQLDNGASMATLSNTESDTVSVTAPTISAPEVLLFQLTVTDNNGAQQSQTHAVNLSPIFAHSACTSDDTTGLPSSGTYATQRVGDVIALCDGEILVGNASSNRIDRVDLATGTVSVSYALTAAPKDLSYDPVRGLVYAAMNGASSIARLDLGSGLVDYIAATGIPSAVAARHADGVYAVSSAGLFWYDANDIEHGPYSITGDMIQYNQSSGHILSARRGISPSVLYLYGFDDEGAIVAIGNSGNAGSNAQTLKISPDNAHVVMVAGAGNGSGYAITDFYSQDLSVTYGEFATGAYPTGGDFSADSSRFATANYSDFFVYDVATHVAIFSATPSASGCSYSDLVGAYISRGGKVAIVQQSCGFYDTDTNLHFYKIP